MSDFTQTTMPPGGRGCGKRKKGGTYGCMGTSPDGTLIWDFLVDPPTPWLGDKFQGMHVALEDMTQNLPDDMLLLLDMVGMEYYPSVPSFVEETGRFGLSRRIPSTFDWTQARGKRVFLGMIHWRAAQTFIGDDLPVPSLPFKHCGFRDADGIYRDDHCPECLYWTWPLTWEFHEHDERGMVVMPWGQFNPLHVIDKRVFPIGDFTNWSMTPEMLATQILPQADFGPGLFAAFPLTHVEAVGYVPEESNVQESGLPVVVMEE